MTKDWRFIPGAFKRRGGCLLGEESFVAPILLWLIMFLCLVISVVKYLMGLILRLSFSSAKIRKDYTWQPKVSVLMPCFNEGKTVYQDDREHQPEQLPGRQLRSHRPGRLLGRR